MGDKYMIVIKANYNNFISTIIVMVILIIFC